MNDPFTIPEFKFCPPICIDFVEQNWFPDGIENGSLILFGQSFD